MEAWISFGRGPLFRLAFALMLLGLGRIMLLTIIGMVEVYRSSPDKIVPFRDLIAKTVSWLFPVKSLFTKRPVYSVVSFVFHLGLILVPLFYSAHVLLWKKSVGIAWFTLPAGAADLLTLAAIAAGVLLFIMRVFYPLARVLSRRQDYLWPLLLVIPFISGYLCAHSRLSPVAYQVLMLVHVYAADAVMLMIPFTKIAHCVLVPLSQLVTGLAWKFRPEAGDRVIETLGYPDRPTWVEKPRLEDSPISTAE